MISILVAFCLDPCGLIESDAFCTILDVMEAQSNGYELVILYEYDVLQSASAYSYSNIVTRNTASSSANEINAFPSYFSVGMFAEVYDSALGLVPNYWGVSNPAQPSSDFAFFVGSPSDLTGGGTYLLSNILYSGYWPTSHNHSVFVSAYRTNDPRGVIFPDFDSHVVARTASHSVATWNIGANNDFHIWEAGTTTSYSTWAFSNSSPIRLTNYSDILDVSSSIEVMDGYRSENHAFYSIWAHPNEGDEFDCFCYTIFYTNYVAVHRPQVTSSVYNISRHTKHRLKYRIGHDPLGAGEP